jgi:hypothetical protein
MDLVNLVALGHMLYTRYPMETSILGVRISVIPSFQ